MTPLIDLRLTVSARLPMRCEEQPHEGPQVFLCGVVSPATPDNAK